MERNTNSTQMFSVMKIQFIKARIVEPGKRTKHIDIKRTCKPEKEVEKSKEIIAGFKQKYGPQIEVDLYTKTINN